MAKKTYDVVTIGGAVRDITFYTNRGRILPVEEDGHSAEYLAFLHGSKIPIQNAFFTLGGGACNTAVSFRTLGLKTAIITSLGKDGHGREIVDELDSQGIDTTWVQHTSASRTGFSFIIASQTTKDHVVFGYRGAGADLKIRDSVLKNLDTRWFYLTSLTGNTPAWQKNLATLFTYASRRNISVAWNPGAPQLAVGKKGLLSFMKRTHVFAVNLEEAYDLVLSESRRHERNIQPLPDDARRAEYLVRTLHAWGPKIVVVTAGKMGAYAYDGKNFHFRSATRAKAVDTTGAGDGFNSSFVAGLIRGPKQLSIPFSLELGRLNTDSLIRDVGAQDGLLSWVEITEHLPKHLRALL